MTLGKLFRKMGLPFWTFMGIGFTSLWFAEGSTIAEKFLRDSLQITDKSSLLMTYVPSGVVFSTPLVLVALMLLWAKARSSRMGKRWFPIKGQKPGGKKGLVLLVSTSASALFAVEYHFIQHKTLEKVWLIPSNDNEWVSYGSSSLPTAQEIEARCQNLVATEGRALTVEIYDSVSPADAQDTFERVNRVYRTGGLQPGEIVCDFTGGTKPMTVGMIMACLPADRELEYVAFNPQARTSSGPYVIDYQHSAFDLVG